MTEDSFRQTIRDHPADSAARLVYADWLEERNDKVSSSKAQLLRLTCDSFTGTPPKHLTKDTAKELARLAKQLDPDWLALMSRCDRPLIDGPVTELLNDSDDRSACHYLVVDHRSVEDDIVDSLAQLIGDPGLTHEWDNAENDLYVIYQGVRHKVGLTLSSTSDRYVAIRKLIEVLRGQWELRVFRDTLGDDTHVFHVERCGWWAAMDAMFPRRMKEVFATVRQSTDFFEDYDYL